MSNDLTYLWEMCKMFIREQQNVAAEYVVKYYLQLKKMMERKYE